MFLNLLIAMLRIHYKRQVLQLCIGGKVRNTSDTDQGGSSGGREQQLDLYALKAVLTRFPDRRYLR